MTLYDKTEYLIAGQFEDYYHSTEDIQINSIGNSHRQETAQKIFTIRQTIVRRN